MKNAPLEIGRVLKPQALKGELKLKSDARDIDIFRDLPYVYVKRGKELIRYEVEKSRTYKGFAYLKLAGIESFEEADALRGAHILADREYVSPVSEGEYYIADVIGLKVFTEAGEDLGEIYDVMQTGSADIYCVKGAKNFMFPAVEIVINEIDIDGGTMTVEKERLKEVMIYD
ncbi:MAG: 16S rRNA processing protein RimM [Clostridia bacterium]|nr:16S rRNA processing protein RimM [Christensenellaceae bacterium]MBR6239384.1 16S rRNA processing protein RimM [Clostridia bacterium]